MIVALACSAIFAVQACAVDTENISLAPVFAWKLYSKGNGNLSGLGNGNVTVTLDSASDLPFYMSIGYGFKNTDNTIFTFQPSYTYRGTFTITYRSTALDIDRVDFSDSFYLCNVQPNYSGYHEYGISQLALAKEITTTTETNSATNQVQETYHFTFRLPDELPADDLSKLAISYLLPARAITSYPATFNFRSITLTDVTYDLSGSAFQMLTLDMLEQLYGDLGQFASQNHSDLLDLYLQSQDGFDNMLEYINALKESNQDAIEQFKEDYIAWQEEMEYNLPVHIGLGSPMSDAEIDQMIENAKDGGIFRQFQQLFEKSSDFFDSFTELFNALNSTSTSFSFYFPDSGELPFVGHLWNRTPIPLKTWIDNLPPAIIYSVRFLFWVGVISTTWFHFRKLLAYVGGDDDE